MPVTVGHVKNITIADGTNTGIVRPSDWNSSHAVTLDLSANEVVKVFAAGTNTMSSGTLSFSDGNGVSFGLNTAGVLTGSVNTNYQSAGAYLTTAAQSNHSHAFATTTTNGSVIVVGTTNSNGVTVGVPAFLTTAQPAGAYLTTARASNDAIGLNTALTANGVSWTVNSGGLSLNVPAFLTTAMASNAGSNFMSTSERGNYFATSNNTFANNTHTHGNISLALTNISGTTASASSGMTLSLSAVGGGVVNQTGPNIADSAATITSGTVVFSNANGVSFGLAGSTMTASVNAGGGITESYWMPFPKGNNTTFSVFGQSSIHLQNLVVQDYVAVSNVELQALYSYASSAVSCQANMSLIYGLYGKGTGTQANSLALIGSSSMSLQASYNSSTTGGFTIGNSASSFTTNTNGGSAMFASISGPKFIYLPFTTTLVPNSEYYWAMNAISNTTGNTGPLRLNFLMQTNMNSTVWGKLNVSTVIGSGTNIYEEFDGLIYSAASANLPSLLATSGLQMLPNQGRFWMIFENE